MAGGPHPGLQETPVAPVHGKLNSLIDNLRIVHGVRRCVPPPPPPPPPYPSSSFSQEKGGAHWGGGGGEGVGWGREWGGGGGAIWKLKEGSSKIRKVNWVSESAVEVTVNI
jgi:hypothetical protein